MDQDSERTSSSVIPGKASRRSHSRAPGPISRKALLAGIDELDVMGPLSVGSVHHNTATVPSFGDSSADHVPDDLTVVADGGREETELDGVPSGNNDPSLEPDGKCGPQRTDEDRGAPSRLDSGVNPKRALASQRVAFASQKRRNGHRAKPVLPPILAWTLAGVTALGAAWYVLQQPARSMPERHWVSGRTR